jgi:hypothetical protein
LKAVVLGIVVAAGCAQAAVCAERPAKTAPTAYDGIIAKHARANGVPETLIRRIIVRESKYNPNARNGGHYGMMQIKPGTAKSMGYQGDAGGLLDADTNLTYGVRYLAGAYKVAGGNEDRAVRLYSTGFYYDAKRKGMLADIGIGRDGKFSKGQVAPATGSFRLAAADAPEQTGAAVPVPPVRDAATTLVQAPQKPSFFMLGRTPAKLAEPAPALAPAVVASAPAIPLPPVRGVVAVAAKTDAPAGVPAARPAPMAVASSVAPLPPVRPGAVQPAPTVVAAQSAPTKRVIAATAQPVLASAGPVLPTKPKLPAAPAAPMVAFAAPAQSAAVPLPPMRAGFAPEVTGSIKR